MSPSLQALRLPFDVFQTQKRMDDYGADDMQCGDLSELQLKNFYRLEKVSGQYDPWRAERTDFPISNYAVIRHKMRHHEVAAKLFNEFRRESRPFSFFGHRGLFMALIDHFQYGDGKPFSSSELNGAYKRLIESAHSDNANSSKVIDKFIRENIDWDNYFLAENKKQALRKVIGESFLPKFNRLQDKMNGLGMSVHGIYATKITLKSLEVNGDKYKATLHYKGQDHFGLDDRDIMDPRFHHLNIFRIWFVLQRWRRYAYKPFFTNMAATITLTGSKK
ncbi:uncharacterized protein (TIGR03034 family) [Erwinia persicina]|jgi:uncharacterized protein (TIGR03034 family)|uniref:DUF3289 family protein n=1 Tax=Erwinia TaxID=551 RepID=UPI0020A1CD87|nr:MULTISPECIES: DUF3289 family protein [Erwinia]MCP1438616.1 uncharacterized protein (TIGR03034 family) [Erwinia persicina]MDN4627745.1 DUF3289 family protein [Erwinia sp. PsM31]